MMMTNEVKTGKLIDVGDGLRIRLVWCEPLTAADWLKKNAENNRNVVRSRVRQYAADMANGKWRLSDQPVTFDREGRLVNGQHRLEACVLSGSAFPTLVLYGLPDESMLTLDGGKKRTTDDNLAMSGKEYPRGSGATVRGVMLGLRNYAGRAYTDQEVTEFLEAYGASVEFAHKHLPRGKTASASTRAVLCRAHVVGKDARRCEDFARVLLSGLMVPGDEAAVLLRNAILEGDVRAAGGTGRSRVYALTETALAAFLDGRAVKRLVPAQAELFPLPNEGSWDE